MGVAIEENSPDNEEELSSRVASGDQSALETLLERNRDRLKKMVMLRLSAKLRSRLDESDIVQEAFIQAALHFENYQHDPGRPFYLWIRKITENKVLEAHRRHIDAAKRSARDELAIGQAAVSSTTLAHLFVESSGSGPMSKAIRREIQATVSEELDGMADLDREVLVMRHFEQLSLAEIALAMGISKTGAAKRYRSAILRLKKVLEKYPGLL